MIRMEDMIIEFFQQLPKSVEFLSKFPFLSIIIQKIYQGSSSVSCILHKDPKYCSFSFTNKSGSI